MVRFAFVCCVFALLACGGSDTSQTGGAGDAGDEPVAAVVEEEEIFVPAVPAPAEPEPAAAAAPEVQSCVDLVRQMEFEKALPVCMAALDVDPDNKQVQEALAQAGTENAKRVAAQQAGAAAAEGAAKEATSKLGGATGGMADKLGQ